MGEAMNLTDKLLLVIVGLLVFVICAWLYSTFGINATQQDWLVVGVVMLAVFGIGLMNWFNRARG